MKLSPIRPSSARRGSAKGKPKRQHFVARSHKTKEDRRQASLTHTELEKHFK